MVDCLQAFQLLFYSGYYCFVPERTVEGEGRMTRELELSPRHGSELVSVQYSLELANDKGIEAGISVAKATGDFGDGIYVESIEEDAASGHVQDDAQLDYKIAAACGVVTGLCDFDFCWQVLSGQGERVGFGESQ